MSTHVIDVHGETAVSAETWRDARYVIIAAPNAYFLHLTAEQAEELAADLIAHANTLRKPSDEELIRDAMADAQAHPGRIVTR